MTTTADQDTCTTAVAIGSPDEDPLNQVGTGYPYPLSSSSRAANSAAATKSPYEYVLRVIIAIVVTFFVVAATFTLFIFFTAVSTSEYPKAELESGTVYGLNATGSELTATWNITLLVTNPDHRYTRTFKHLKAMLYYRDQMIGSTPPLPPFVLNKRSQTRIHINLAGASRPVGGDVVVKEINDERSQRFLKVGVSLRACSRHSVHDLLNGWCFWVTCYPVYFGLYDNETAGVILEQIKCHVG